MAEKRMFAKTIIDSDAFLDMPTSAQALYFHLSMRADDEGFINNPKKIVRVVSCSEDDLKLLIAKRFIIPFESGIVVIKHWKIHNYIRKDRLRETVYHREKAQLSTKENNSYTLLPDKCPSDVSQLPDKCQHRLDKNRLDQYRLDEGSTDNSPAVPYEKIKDLFNSICISYSKVRTVSAKRKEHIRARYKQYNNDLAVFNELFTMAEESSFLKGKNKRNWKADFDWLINDNNMAKVLEGRYRDAEPSDRSHDRGNDTESAYDYDKFFA